MPRFLLIGAGGQLGRDLAPLFDRRELVALGHEDLDVRDEDALRSAFDAHRPSIVVNAAAYNRVDDAEREAQEAFGVNALAPLRVARLCAERDAVLVHFSTDYVFDGRAKEPYTEDDAANPLSVYGASKLSGEHLVRLACPRHFVVRTCGLYGRDGSRGKGGNFVTTMLRLAGRGTPIRVVADQVLTPTATKDLASLTRRLLDTAAYGLYHATAAGQCSWYEFAARIFELAGLHPELSPISTEEFGAAARRPAYSVLDNAALRSIGLDDLRPWDEALAEFVRALDV